MKATHTPKSSRRFAFRGFSLVEVVVATGIASMGITTLFALLPMGLNIFRESMDVSISAQIGEGVIRESQQTDYNSLLAVSGLPPVPGSTVPIVKPVRFFDDQGIELTSSAGAVYYAHMRIVPTTALPNSVAPWASNSLATVVVQVVVNPTNKTVSIMPNSHPTLGGMVDPDSGLPIFTYTGHLARIK